MKNIKREKRNERDDARDTNFKKVSMIQSQKRRIRRGQKRREGMKR